MEFNFLKLVFTLTLEDDLDDPYILFGISGNGFRWAERGKGVSGIIGGGTFTGSMV